MTESSLGVEPPIMRRSVRRMIGVLAILLACWQTVSLIRYRFLDPFGGASDAAIRLGRERVQNGGTLIQIDLNHAEARELLLLPGVGPVLARRIVENRQRLGPFESVEALTRVPGIGTKKLEQIRSLGFVATPSD